MRAFAVGDVVRTVVDNPEGHTRLPRYARGRRGRVVAVHEAFALPEQAAAGVARPERGRVYTVEFAGEQLWGASAERGCAVRVDLWEHYLQPDGRPA